MARRIALCCKAPFWAGHVILKKKSQNVQDWGILCVVHDRSEGQDPKFTKLIVATTNLVRLFRLIPDVRNAVLLGNLKSQIPGPCKWRDSPGPRQEPGRGSLAEN